MTEFHITINYSHSTILQHNKLATWIDMHDFLSHLNNNAKLKLASNMASA